MAATLVPGCVIQGGPVIGLLDFGNHAGISGTTADAGLVQNGAFKLACTPGTPLMISIDGGQHYRTTRNLELSGNTTLVPYRLYSNSSMSPSSEIPVNQSLAVDYLNPDAIMLPVYARLTPNRFQRAGTYTDSLTVTLSW